MAAAADPVRPRLGQSGSATVEFAITAPVLALLLLGICDVAPSLMAKFKVAAATQTMADLVSLSTTVASSDVVTYFAAGADVMAPFSASGLSLRVSNIFSDGQGNTVVYWSCGQGMSPKTAFSKITTGNTDTTPPKLLTLTALGTNTSYIMVESRYTYTAPARFILSSAQTITAVAYALPRISTYVGPSTGSSTYVPTPPASSTPPAKSFAIGSITCSYAS